MRASLKSGVLFGRDNVPRSGRSYPRPTARSGEVALALLCLAVNQCTTLEPRVVAPTVEQRAVDVKSDAPVAVAAELAAASPATVGESSESVEAVPVPSHDDLRDRIRRRDWDSARVALEALAVSGVGGAYTRARLALEQGRYGEALEDYRALTAYPELEPLVAVELRRALARSGAVAALDARERLRVDSEDWLLAIETLLAERRYDEAGVVIGEAAKRSLGNGRLAQRLHAARARWAVAKDLPYRALVDWRWLVVHAPASPEGRDAAEHLANRFPTSKLSEKEWDRRVDALVDAGAAELVVQALDERTPPPSAGARAHFIGWAHYKARDYAPASEWLSRSAQGAGPNAASDSYYAGQALSRLGLQDDAIRHFERVIALSPKSQLAGLAALRVAREHALAGRFDLAATAYTHFLDAHPKHEQTEAALRERAVARYANGDFERAAFEFKRVRYLRPRSTLAPLYKHLEALSLLGTPKAEEAIPLLEETVQERPLSFEGLVARLRLEALARPQPDLLPQKPEPFAEPLPAAVQALESIGWFHEAERLLVRAEPNLRTGAQARFEAECAAYGQLFAGRRRLLVGLSAAAATGFSANPAAAPGWVWPCVYPAPFAEWVERGSREFDVPASMVYAIMRQESGFRLAATSTADARGLMQIIPPTALEIARALGEAGEADTEVRFEDPSRNVRYGIYYLGFLRRMFGGHPALTAAGYNAGPAAVALWFAQGQALPLEMFVAQIPYDETRTYVMRVLSNLAAYQLLDPAQGTIDIPLELR